jgi:hypothetical protein
MTGRFDIAKAELLAELATPRTVADALDLMCPEAIEGYDGSIQTICPFHWDTNPSLSIFNGEHGRVRLYCHGCEASFDVFGAVACLHELDVWKQFTRVLAKTAELAGRLDIANALMRGKPLPRSARLKPRCTEPALLPAVRDYPPDVGGFLVECCNPVAVGDDVAEFLERRGINVAGVVERRLASSLRLEAVLPPWAKRRTTVWSASGHNLITPMYDEAGMLRSVRARCWGRAAELKTLTPAGHRVSGLVFANEAARDLLTGDESHDFLVVAEGEVDYLSWAVGRDSRPREFPVIGIASGSWTTDLAARVPDGTRVVIRVDSDQGGDRYAEKIINSLKGRCRLFRTKPSDKDENDKLLAAEIGDDPFVGVEEIGKP